MQMFVILDKAKVNEENTRPKLGGGEAYDH
jgi:hypothetical protein